MVSWLDDLKGPPVALRLAVQALAVELGIAASAVTVAVMLAILERRARTAA